MPKFYGQLEEASLENLSSDPGSLVAGRIWRNSTEERVKTDDGVLKRALLRNDQHAVIGNHVTDANNIRIHRGADGLLQLVAGGDTTAEGTLATALNKISAKIESYTDAGLPAFGNQGRLVYITDTNSFAFDTGAAWSKIRLARPQVAQATTSSTFATPGTPAIGQGTRYCDASGGAFALTIPTAVGNGGEFLDFQKTDSTFNVVTLTGVTTLNTQNEKVRLRSNNVSWVVEDRYIPSSWAATTFTFTGGLIGAGANTQEAFSKREGDSLDCRIYWAPANTAAGQGNIVFPAGIAMDTAKFTTNHLQLGTWFASDGNIYAQQGRTGMLLANTGSPSQVYLVRTSAGGTPSVLSINTVFGGGTTFQFNFKIPVSGWAG